MADTVDSKSTAARRAGSSPAFGTKALFEVKKGFFLSEHVDYLIIHLGDFLSFS
jgi:hypothetical protein